MLGSFCVRKCAELPVTLYCIPRSLAVGGFSNAERRRMAEKVSWEKPNEFPFPEATALKCIFLIFCRTNGWRVVALLSLWKGRGKLGQGLLGPKDLPVANLGLCCGTHGALQNLRRIRSGVSLAGLFSTFRQD